MGPLEGNWSNVAVVWRMDAADITTQIWPSWKWRAILDFSRANWYDVIHRVILRRISLNPRMEDKTHSLYYNSEENPYEMAAILKMAAISNFFFQMATYRFFRLVKLYRSWKFHACCQNGTIFSPNCWTISCLPASFRTHVDLAACRSGAARIL